MLIKLFRGAGPGGIVLIIFTALCIWLSIFLSPVYPLTSGYDINPMPLYGILKLILSANSFYGVIFTFLLTVVMMFLISNFNTSHFFINERTFLPSVIFILLSGLFPKNQMLNPVLPASVFLMLAIRRITDSYRKAGTAYDFFDASILIGTGSLFYANLAWFAILVFIGIGIFRTGNIIEFVISIIGLITPGLITAGIYYTLGKDLTSLSDSLTYNLFSSAEKYTFSTFITIGMILLGIICLISLFHLFSLLNNKKIKSRKTFIVLIWSLVICLAIYSFSPTVSVEIMWLASIPISYIVGHYLILSRGKLLPEICFGIIMLISIIQQIINL